MNSPAIIWITLLSTVYLPRPASPMTSDERHRMMKLERSVEVLSRQLMMLQFSQKEMRRSDGDSGIKQVRLNRDGTRPYHTNSHTGASVASMHDHANMKSTLGLGEIEAVLNGVFFRTRHNDYSLRMPTDNGEYHETVDIPFPAVPPAVLEKKTVEEQIFEMREWFRAWKHNDASKRDYRPYFKPVLCYLEGAWTTDLTLEEPFHSERHKLKTSDIQHMQDTIRFTSYTGDKNTNENLAYLPTMILNITDGVPSIAQWNYRILCHPIKENLKLTDFKPIDDLGNRLAKHDVWGDYVKSRAVRFSLNPFQREKLYKWTILDKIMKQIPGKNGYGSRLTDKAMGGLKLNGYNNRALNTAYYHRWYKMSQAGAMGERVAHTGFADRNLFVAQTTQPRVAPMSVTSCRTGGRRKPRSCLTHTTRVSYAIPLEIVFLTPLHSWNPYRLRDKGSHLSELGRTVTAGGRTGTVTSAGAFNGTNSRYFYRTPAKFFRSGKEVDSDPADTVKGIVGVLDPENHVRSVVASGLRIFLPEIRGLGVLRTRYPIMPVYAEGNTIWKEVEALKEIVMSMKKHQKFFRDMPSFLEENDHAVTKLDNSTATTSTKEKAKYLRPGGEIEMTLSVNQRKISHKQAVSSSYIPLLPPPHPPALSGVDGNELEVVTTLNEFPEGNDTHEVIRLPPASLHSLHPTQVTLVTSPSQRSYVTLHVHTLEVNRAQLYAMVKRGRKVTMRTNLDGGHSHLLVVGFNRKTQYFYVHRCDGRPKCWDGHSKNLEKLRSNNVEPMPGNLRRFG